MKSIWHMGQTENWKNFPTEKFSSRKLMFLAAQHLILLFILGNIPHAPSLPMRENCTSLCYLVAGGWAGNLTWANLVLPSRISNWEQVLQRPGEVGKHPGCHGDAHGGRGDTTLAKTWFLILCSLLLSCVKENCSDTAKRIRKTLFKIIVIGVNYDYCNKGERWRSALNPTRSSWGFAVRRRIRGCQWVEN